MPDSVKCMANKYPFQAVLACNERPLKHFRTNAGVAAVTGWTLLSRGSLVMRKA